MEGKSFCRLRRQPASPFGLPSIAFGMRAPNWMRMAGQHISGLSNEFSCSCCLAIVFHFSSPRIVLCVSFGLPDCKDSYSCCLQGTLGINHWRQHFSSGCLSEMRFIHIGCIGLQSAAVPQWGIKLGSFFAGQLTSN